MKVKTFIANLSQFDPEAEVIVTDGFGYRFYKSNSGYTYQFQSFEGKVDIGIGGMEEVHES